MVRNRVRGRGRSYDRRYPSWLGCPGGLGSGRLAARECEYDRCTRDRIEPDSEGEHARRRADQIQPGRESDADDTEENGNST